MFESAQKRCETCMCPFKPSLGSQDTEATEARPIKDVSLKMFNEPKIHGLIISFPTQTAISAYAVSPGFKGGPQKDVVFFVH